MIPLAVIARPGSAKQGTFLLSLPPVRQVGMVVRPGIAAQVHVQLAAGSAAARLLPDEALEVAAVG